jgi:hypothetical protein
MARDFYIDNRDHSENPVFRRILIIVLTLVLIASGVFGFLLLREQNDADEVLQTFAAALADSDYDQALPIYRDMQEKALSGGLFGRNKELYNNARISMEALIDEVLDEFETRLRAGESLSAADLKLAEEMGEVTGLRLTALVRSLCVEYLAGEVELPVVESALNQLADLENLKATIGGLPAQLEKLTEYRPDFIQASDDLAANRFLEAAAGFQKLAESEVSGSMVRQFSAQKLDETKTKMYAPLLAEIDIAMAGNRYVTATASIEQLAVYFPEDAKLKAKKQECQQKLPGKLVEFTGSVEHIVIRPLIVNPAAAFDGDSYAQAANDAMLTTSEFSNILTALHAKGYILIDVNLLADENGKPQALRLPEGKRPLVLTIEGLNYYATRLKSGTSENLVLDETGEVSAVYIDATGQRVTAREAEAIGLLDTFVSKNPDFSFDGAKGTISLTGYECVFGYITDRDQLDDRNQALEAVGLAQVSPDDSEIAANREAVKKIIQRLRETGWNFASSTYGFINARDQDMSRIVADTEKWLAQVGSLTGPVRVIHYPNGSFINGSDLRARYLIDQGFVIFGGLGATPYQYAGEGYLYIDKTIVNGFSLRNSKTYQLERFFDNPAGILDTKVRPKK